MRNPSQIYPVERLISALSYITIGTVGFVWLIIASLLRKKITKFLLYHIFQSIFLYMLFALVMILLNLIGQIPIINNISFFIFGIISMPIPLFLGYSLLQVTTTCLILYLSISSFLGRYSYLPWVSDVITYSTGKD